MKGKKAFTLVELIIVIAIIAILSVSAFMVLTKWIGKSRDSRRISDLGTIQRALSTHLADYDANNDGDFETGNLNEVTMSGGTITAGSGGTASYVGDFDKAFMDAQDNFDVLQKVVTDPNPNDNNYQIGLNRNNKEFTIAATLENGDSNKTTTIRGNFSSGTVLTTANGGTGAVSSLNTEQTATEVAPNEYLKEDDLKLPYDF